MWRRAVKWGPLPISDVVTVVRMIARVCGSDEIFARVGFGVQHRRWPPVQGAHREAPEGIAADRPPGPSWRTPDHDAEPCSQS